MPLHFEHVNWLALPVAAAASFLVGGLWYAVLFGKAWARLHGYDAAALAEMEKTQGRTFGIFFAVDLVAALVISLLLGLLPAPSLVSGLELGAILWLGIGLVETTAQNAAHRRPVAAWAMDASHQLVSLMVMGAILGAWR